MHSRRTTPTSEGGSPVESRRDTQPEQDPPRHTEARDTYVDENEIAKGADAPGSGVRPLDGLDYDDVGETAVERSSETPLDREDAASTAVGLEPASPDTFDAPKVGDTIDGRYVIERVVGRGATGIVYEATHRLIGKRLAIKCLHPQTATSPTAVQRLFREARISAGLRHPNVVEVFDAGRDGELYYLTMELLEGEPLREWLERELRPVPEIVRIFLAIMDGVAAVHEAGVVHRDLKPDNVFLVLGEDGLVSPKVLDFGVSKLYEPDRQALTTLGMTMGTPYYMAPEQVTDSHGVDARADVYSLGVMLYEALTGRVPYDGDSLLEIFTRSMEGRPIPLRELRPDVPASLEALVARAMCPERSVRYPDVRSMRDALAAVPFDGSDAAEDWSDESEPWMLDPTGGQGMVRPLESAPTQVASIPGGTTVPMHASEPARGTTVEWAPAKDARGTTIEWTPPPGPAASHGPILVAVTAACVVAFGALAALAWWLLF
ncbi:MAG TPA: serine/threonine-protein kinase [Sandaracinaceae bacterium]